MGGSLQVQLQFYKHISAMVIQITQRQFLQPYEQKVNKFHKILYIICIIITVSFYFLGGNEHEQDNIIKGIQYSLEHINEI